MTVPSATNNVSLQGSAAALGLKVLYTYYVYVLYTNRAVQFSTASEKLRLTQNKAVTYVWDVKELPAGCKSMVVADFLASSELDESSAGMLKGDCACILMYLYVCVWMSGAVLMFPYIYIHYIYIHHIYILSKYYIDIYVYSLSIACTSPTS